MDSKEKTIELIEQALETVRPYLHADGGDVKLVELTDDLTVKLELQGSCQSCPIRKAVPYINKVVSSNVPELA
jgi:Fe-S cluster biogenesis protein NfuA